MNLLDDDDEFGLRDGVRRALSDCPPHEALGLHTQPADEIAAQHFAMAEELGWCALLVDEDHGGAGLGPVELVTVCEELGAGLFCGPWLGSAVLRPMLHDLGRRVGVEVDIDTVAWCMLNEVPPSPSQPRPRWLAEHPALAGRFCLLRIHRGDDGGAEVHWQDTAADRTTLGEALPSLDPGCPLALVEQPGAEPVRHACSAGELAAWLLPLDLAMAAEYNGISAAVLQRSVQWLNERHQFGRPVGSFQALKHRVAEGYTAFRKALLLTRAAARQADPSRAAMARTLAGDAALRCSRDYLQFLGGAGVSSEMDAHLYLKRALRIGTAHAYGRDARRECVDSFLADRRVDEHSVDR